MKKSFPLGFVAGFALMLLLSGAGCYVFWNYYLDGLFQEMLSGTSVQVDSNTLAEQRTNPLYYSIDEIFAKVEKTERITSELLPGDLLESNAKECENGMSTGLAYWGDLSDLFTNANQNISYEYLFSYKGESQDPKNLYVTVVPNAAGWTTMKEFKDNLNVCSVGGNLYPYSMNDQWLVFESSCGSGFDDGSGKPIGCSVIKDTLNQPGNLQLR